MPEETKKPTKEELFQIFVIHHSQNNIEKESLEWLNVNMLISSLLKDSSSLNNQTRKETSGII